MIGHPNMQKYTIKAILFDLDDTLWPVTPVLQHAESTLYQWLQQHVPHITSQYSIEDLTLQRQNIAAEDAAYRINLWLLRHTALQRLFIQHDTSPELADEAMQIFSDARNKVTLYQDVLPVLQQLRQHYSLGTITNGTVNLDQTPLNNLFQVSVSSYKLGIAKPDQAIFQHTCQLMNIQPEEAVYVGDHLNFDVKGSQQAGLTSVWLNRNQVTNETGITPDVVCHNMEELRDWLQHNTQFASKPA